MRAYRPYTVHEDNSITISNEQLLANSVILKGKWRLIA
ncbi:cadherin-like domain-containing protein [Vibrio chagasii]|nr:cadherin-like domain-containing protein [Vibrio chagasii]